MTDHAALVQALLATCDRLGMTNIPADAPAAFARVLGEFAGSGPGDACRAAAEEVVDLLVSGYTGSRESMIEIVIDYITRHLPSDRYGEGFAAGVEAAAKHMGDITGEGVMKAAPGYCARGWKTGYGHTVDGGCPKCGATSDQNCPGDLFDAEKVSSSILTLTLHGDDHG